MAFCKHCGTEYPDGGSCPNPACPGSQQQPAFQQQPAQAGGNPLDGGFNDVVNKAKNNMGIIIGAVAAFIVLVIVLVFLAGHTGAKGAANTYAKNLYKKNGYKNFIKVQMLNKAYKEYKSDGDLKDDAEEFKEEIEDMKDDGIKIKIKSVKKGKKLKSKQLKAAKLYFKAQAEEYDVDASVSVTKGYEFKIKYKYKEDGDTEVETDKICVVKVKGNGWKVIPFSADYLYDDDYDD